MTFRLSDSLPQEKLEQWMAERDAWLAAHPPPRDPETERRYVDRFPNRIHRWLDAGSGSCILRNQKARAMIENALRYFDGQRYDLDEFVVAANHVHAVVAPTAGNDLSKIIHSWKSFTAHQLLKWIRAGELPPATFRNDHVWQRESFDHVIRNPTSLEKIRAYIKAHKQ